MSSLYMSKTAGTLEKLPLGAWLRHLRRARKLPLRRLAAAADMDTAYLSKIELGQRLPTEKQTAAFAIFFGIPLPKMAAKRLAEKFWMENKDNPAAKQAAAMIRETAPAYTSNRIKAGAKSSAPVNKTHPAARRETALHKRKHIQ